MPTSKAARSDALPRPVAPELEEPYPLARRFYSRLLPFAVIALAAVVAAVGLAVKTATENAYLSHATRVAESIGADVAKKAPGTVVAADAGADAVGRGSRGIARRLCDRAVRIPAERS